MNEPHQRGDAVLVSRRTDGADGDGAALVGANKVVRSLERDAKDGVHVHRPEGHVQIEGHGVGRRAGDVCGQNVRGRALAERVHAVAVGGVPGHTQHDAGAVVGDAHDTGVLRFFRVDASALAPEQVAVSRRKLRRVKLDLEQAASIGQVRDAEVCFANLGFGGVVGHKELHAHGGAFGAARKQGVARRSVGGLHDGHLRQVLQRPHEVVFAQDVRPAERHRRARVDAGKADDQVDTFIGVPRAVFVVQLPQRGVHGFIGVVDAEVKVHHFTERVDGAQTQDVRVPVGFVRRRGDDQTHVVNLRMLTGRVGAVAFRLVLHPIVRPEVACPRLFLVGVDVTQVLHVEHGFVADVLQPAQQ